VVITGRITREELTKKIELAIEEDEESSPPL
jgi:hypothetical protein